MHDKTKEIRKELMTVHSNNRDGILRAEDVVDFAKNKSTTLHSRFEWDDNVAGHKYRLQQARMVIREFYVVEGESLGREPREVRTFVSVPSDRKVPGGGYREVRTVLTDEERCMEIVTEIWARYNYYRKKYESFAEFSEIHAAIDRAGTELGVPDEHPPIVSDCLVANEKRETLRG